MAKSNPERSAPRVIVLGAGFGGLEAARRLAGKPAEVLIIDRNNYHTFTPLLYQVATCALDPGEIAFPVRSIFRNSKNVDFLMAEILKVDPIVQGVEVEFQGRRRQESYDYLVFALGSANNPPPTIADSEAVFQLRTLEDAIAIRNHILRQLEEAVWLGSLPERAACLTVFVVGGGPTGLETAGAVYELYNHLLKNEFGEESLKANVILVEATDHLLDPYPPQLRSEAVKQLESLGVQIMLGRRLERLEPGIVVLDNGERIDARTVIWSTGVRGSPLLSSLGLPLAGNGRVSVERTLATGKFPNIYVIGDSAYLESSADGAYPMMIPPAMQQGALAARNILADVAGRAKKDFRYVDRGLMATIGRSRAVAYLYNRVPLSGPVAWAVWLTFHLVTLLGFRNRVNVFVNWAWNYLTYDRGVRIILD